VRRALAIAALAASALAISATQAFATGAVIVASDGADVSGFDTTNPTIAQGIEALFSNADDITHNVTANEDGPDGKALFRSGNTPGGEIDRAVAGTQFLSEGDYPFRCTLHPSTMTGTLEVLSTGIAQERPEISVKVKSKKLGKVVSSGKLKVKVEAAEPTMADGIKLKAKKGKKGISKGKKLNLAAGADRTVKLKLSDKGIEKLADLEKAKVKVQGTVDFGFGDKASKKLK
jgi:plastocyanin